MDRESIDRVSINGEARRPKDYMHSSVLYIYEDILHRKGIHENPIKEESFNLIYARYQSLGGERIFHFHLK